MSYWTLTNCAWNEQFESVLFGDLEDIMEALNVDLHGQGHILLPNGTQQGSEVNQPIHLIVDNNLPKTLEVQDISKEEWSCRTIIER